MGGEREKVAAALEAGAQLVMIPMENDEECFTGLPMRIQPVSDISEVIKLAFDIYRPVALKGVEGLGANPC